MLIYVNTVNLSRASDDDEAPESQQAFLDTDLLQKYGETKDVFRYYCLEEDNMPKLYSSMSASAATFAAMLRQLNSIAIAEEGGTSQCVARLGKDRLVVDAALEVRRLTPEEYEAQQWDIIQEFDVELDEEHYAEGLYVSKETKAFLHCIEKFVDKLRLLGLPAEEKQRRIVAYIQKVIAESGKTYEELIGSLNYYFDDEYNLQEAYSTFNFREHNVKIALLGTSCEVLSCFYECDSDANTGECFIADCFVTSKLQAVLDAFAGYSNNTGVRRRLYCDESFREELFNKPGVRLCTVVGLTDMYLDMQERVNNEYIKYVPLDVQKFGDVWCHTAGCMYVSTVDDDPIYWGDYNSVTLRNMNYNNIPFFDADNYVPVGTASKTATVVPYIMADQMRVKVLTLIDSNVVPNCRADKLVVKNLDESFFIADTKKVQYYHRVYEVQDGTGLRRELLLLPCIEEVILSGSMSDYTEESLTELAKVIKDREFKGVLTVLDTQVAAFLEEN